MTAPTIDRSGPADSFTDEEGSRYYEIDGRQYWSVTTALKIMAKDGLPPWAAGLSTKAAFEELPRILLATRTKPCGNSYNQCRQGRGANAHDWRITCSTCPCQRCQTCMTKWLTERHIAVRDRRADEGRRTHDWIEEWVLSGGVIAPMPDDIAPFIRGFLSFVKAYGLRPDSWQLSEATVVHRGEEYAGTTDGILRFESQDADEAAAIVAMLLQRPKSECVAKNLVADVVVDFKTKDDPPEKAVKFYDDVALQLAAYRHAEVVRIKRLGLEEKLQDTHGGMAVRLYPDRVVPRLCVVDEKTYQAFLWALKLYRWHIECGTAAVSTRSFKVPPEPKPAKAAPTKRPPARKTAKKAATQEALVDQPPQRPLKTVAAEQSATMAALKAWPAKQPVPTPHPDSPMGDEIPF